MNDIVSIARNKLVEFIGTITKNIVCQNLYQAAFYKESSLKRYIGRNIFLRVNILTILDSPLTLSGPAFFWVSHEPGGGSY